MFGYQPEKLTEGINISDLVAPTERARAAASSRTRGPAVAVRARVHAGVHALHALLHALRVVDMV